MLGPRGFLERVAGPGIHYIAWPSRVSVVGGPARPGYNHSPFTDVDKALARIARLVTHNDIYFTPASFKVEKIIDDKGREKSCRKAENVSVLRSFYADIDFKLYDRRETAILAFKEFLKKIDFPRPNIVVSSGGGLHVYWVLDIAVRLEEWLPVAKALVSAMRKFNLVADYEVTTDAARLLRVPGTVNRKYDHRPVVTVIAQAPDDIPFEEMRNKLSAYADTAPVTSLRPNDAAVAVLPIVGNTDLTAGYDTTRVYEAERIVSSCPVFADSMARRGDGDPYPLWVQLLHVMAYAEGGEETARALSDGDPRYTPEGFAHVWNDRVALANEQRIGPTTCEKFASLTNHCRLCPHFGKIKTPLVLGYSAPDAKAADVGAGRLPSPTFIRKGATYMTRIGAGGEPEEVKVVDCEVDGWEIGHDQEKGRFIRFKFAAGSTRDELVVYLGTVADEAELQRQLLAKGMPITRNGARLFSGAVIGWMDHLQRSQRVEEAPGFGWDSDGGFSIAGERYSGGQRVTRSGHVDQALQSAYRPSGTLEQWKAVSAVFERDQRPSAHVMMASAFASPLLHFIEQPSFLLAVCGPLSGVGKTTFLRYIASVWGDPNRGILSLDDTSNAIVARMSATRYLPTLWDEVRSEQDFDRFTNVAFRTLQGSSKQRLNQKSELRNAPSINTAMVVTANASVLDAVAIRTRGSPAGLYRLLEIEMPPIMGSRGDADAVTSASISLKRIHGVAGRAYVDKLTSVGVSSLQKFMQPVVSNITDRASASPQERFWVQGASVIIAGAMLARRFGIANIDVEAVTKMLLSAIKRGRVSVQSSEELLDNTLAELFGRYSGNVVILNSLSPLPVGRVDVLEPPPTRVAKLFVGVKDDSLMVPMQVLEEYAEAKRLSVSQLRLRLQQTVGARELVCVPGAGSSYALGRTRVIRACASKALGPEYLQRYR
jgi:hypothetical protein